MKRLLALLMILVLCISLCACKKDKDPQNTPAQKTTNAECTEQELLTLIDRNIDCYIIYYVSPLAHTTQQNSDGYMGVEKGYFEDYNSLKNFVEDTYTSDCAEQYFLQYPSKDAPLYKEAGGGFFVNPEIKPEDPDYNIDCVDPVVKITKSTKSECIFEAAPYENGPEEYKVIGKALYENGKWRLAQVIH